MLGSIEAGGTKFVCAVGRDDGGIVEEAVIPTSAPGETMARVAEFFVRFETLEAMGIASFGPVQLDRSAADYGFITSTPKREWRNFDIAGAIRSLFAGPIGFDTDVNAAALAENLWGAGAGLDSFLYVTVGTGIGAGAMVDRALLHGRSHPEMGHIRIPHDLGTDPFAGDCPYHGDCLEGLASGSALEARWGVEASLLPDEHEAWKLEARYLGLAAMNWTCCFSPRRIIFGGGVMRPHLIGRIHDGLDALLAGYMDAPEIVLSPLKNRAGVLGGLALAAEALRLR